MNKNKSYSEKIFDNYFKKKEIYEYKFDTKKMGQSEFLKGLVVEIVEFL